MQASVLVVISTYNGAKNICRQLDSIFAQEDVQVSVLIRDDNSSDDTIEVIHKYQSDNPKCSIEIISGENVGYAKSFWIGLKEARNADYYAFSDQDDVWKPSKLRKCIGKMDVNSSLPQLVYCNMQRSDAHLNRLDEQVEVLSPEKLRKKLVLTQTYNYGAATVINLAAKELVCRAWPEGEDIPHDMWVGLLCYWFGKVYYVNEELYYWIRYSTSVTGSGTKFSGVKYRIKKTLNHKSYPNTCSELLSFYDDVLIEEDREFLMTVSKYKTSLRAKMMLLFDKEFRRTSLSGTVALKIGILMNWF